MAKIAYKTELETRSSGKVFLVIALLIQLAAFNAGENLLYIISAAVISFLIIAFFATRANLRRLSVTRDAPHSVHREDPFWVLLRIDNDKRCLPTLSLRIATEANPKETIAYIDKIPAGGTATIRLEQVLNRRGVHALPPLVLSSGFPLGLLWRWCRLGNPMDVVVYPKINTIRKSVLEQVDSSGETPKVKLGDGDEFYGLREYQPGDDIRHISWRVSARMGDLIIRELEPSTSRLVLIVFDTRGIPDTEELAEHFEDAVDLVASLAVSYLNRQYSVGIITPDHATGMGSGKAQTTKILEMLARVQAVHYQDYGDDWFIATGDLGAAMKVFAASDPSLWGLRWHIGRAKVLDPREVVHG